MVSELMKVPKIGLKNVEFKNKTITLVYRKKMQSLRAYGFITSAIRGKKESGECLKVVSNAHP